MKKEHFNQLVVDYSELDNQFKELELLVSEFPYSQPVRMLNIKSSTSLSAAEFRQRLALAAFYTTDRNVLRSLIEKGKVPGDYIDKVIPTAPKQKKIAKKLDRRIHKETELTKINADDLRAEVLANLELLQQSKSAFLKIPDLSTAIKKPKKKFASKPNSSPLSRPVSKPTKAKKSKKKKTLTSKKKELIDKFIEDEPRITPKKILDENQSDLSSASSELKEDLVSENLAIIFAKQGKAIKAIEIYKKLIWKFPQKKASFAAQIEKLKKKK